LYKVDLVPTEELYKHLELLGIDSKLTFQDVLDGEQGTPRLVVGIGHTGGGIYDFVYSLMYGESTLFISNDGGIGKNILEMFINVSGYRDSFSKNAVFNLENDEVLELQLDNVNANRVRTLIESLFKDFSLGGTDDDEEYISANIDLQKELKKFEKLNSSTYAFNWDDRDDLEGLSKVWSFNLMFGDD
jgi:hypothetical protein